MLPYSTFRLHWNSAVNTLVSAFCCFTASLIVRYRKSHNIVRFHQISTAFKIHSKTWMVQKKLRREEKPHVLTLLERDVRWLVCPEILGINGGIAIQRHGSSRSWSRWRIILVEALRRSKVCLFFNSSAVIDGLYVPERLKSFSVVGVAFLGAPESDFLLGIIPCGNMVVDHFNWYIVSLETGYSKRRTSRFSTKPGHDIFSTICTSFPIILCFERILKAVEISWTLAILCCFIDLILFSWV